jgi:hypothetical protein
MYLLRKRPTAEHDWRALDPSLLVDRVNTRALIYA